MQVLDLKSSLLTISACTFFKKMNRFDEKVEAMTFKCSVLLTDFHIKVHNYTVTVAVNVLL